MPRKLVWSTLTVLLAHFALLESVLGASIHGGQASSFNGAAVAASRLPLYFESNQGQTAGDVRFLARAGGYTAFLTGQETVLLYHNGMPGQKPGRDALVRMRLAGSRESSVIEGSGRLPGVVNYLIGDDPSKWHTRIPTYGDVDREQVYPGVDLTYRANGKELEFDFHIAPGASPHPIRMTYSGPSKLHLNVAGDLILDTDAGPVSFLKPFAYQEVDSKRVPIAARYALLPGGEVGFQMGEYDRSRPLVIDPTVGPSVYYSTYLGSGDGDTFTSIAVDAAGEAFICGDTYATNYPTGAQPGYSPYLSTFPGNYAINFIPAGFVTALNSTGTGIIYSTYIAGDSASSSVGVALNGIAVDPTGFAFVGGQTDDHTFPTMKAFQSAIPNSRTQYGDAVGVVFELSQHGDSLIYSSFLGGGDYDTISAIAVDGSDNAYVTGTNTVQSNSLTTSGFPVTSGVIWGHFTQQNIGAGFNDAFAAKITPPSSGNAILAYSTVIGSAGSNTPFTYGSAIAVDSSGDAYIAGSADCNIGDHGGTITTNLNMSHVTRAQSEYVDNVWVLELNPAATAAPYIAYLGGSAPSGTYSPSTSLAGIKVDSTGQAYVAGTTEANNFQTTSGAYQATKQLAGVINSGTEQSDGFVTVIAAAGASFTYSTYLNGTTASPSAIVNGSDGSASISGIALGTGGQFAVSGLATTTNFPISGNPAGTPLLSAFPGCPGSCASDVAFITKFTTSGLVYSTFLGAGNEAGVNGIASNGTDMFVLLGEPSNGLNTCGAYDSDNSSGAKELVVRVLDAPAIATAVSVDAKTANVSSSQQTISLTSTISASSTVNGGTATYTVTNSSVTQIGSAVTSEIVSNGLPPSLSFTLPANTPIGTYTIREQYCGAEGFLNSSATGSLIVSSAGPATTTSVTSSLNPSGFGQSVTFTATVTSAAAAPTGSVQFEVDGANLGGAVALTAASSTSKAATSQATTTLTATGSPHTVQANYLNGDGNFSDSSGTLVGGQTVTLAGQATLTVTGVPVTAQPYGTTFTVGSSGGSGTGAVTFAATGSCSVTGTTVTITSGSGTCSLTATKAANSGYASANSAAVIVSATTATQATLTVTGVPVTARTYGTTFTVSSSGGSGTGSVTFAATGSCSVSGTTVTITSGSGTCSLTATKAADANYANATSAAATVSATTATQATLTVTGVPVTAQPYGTTFTVGSSGGSGTGAVTFAATGSCSVSGATVTITSGTGTCSVTATKAADANYSSASSAGATVSATTATQATLTVTGVPVTAQPYGTTFTVGSSGGSGTGAVTFAATGSCSVTGTTVTITSGTGTCSVIATKAADANYINATSAAATVSATTAAQAPLTVTGVPVTAQSYGTTFTVGSGGGSGTGAVTFAATGSCSVSGGTVTITSGTGTCSVTATKAADANYSSASSAGATVSATTATQATLTVTGVPVTAQPYGTTFTVGSSGGSGTGAVTFAATGNCSVSGTTVTITSGTGTCSVTATKAADANYSSASSAGATVSATTATQATLTVTGVPVTAQPYGTTFTVGSSGGSGTGAVTFAATGSCSVTGTTVTITSGSGTCSLTATKAADANYINATSAAVELQVTRSETITTLVITPGTTVNAGTAITLTATIPGGYPGTVTFCTANAAQCSAVQLNSSGIATLKFIPGVGIYSIVAAFGGTSTEGASSSAAQTLTINGAGNYLSSTSIAATGVPGNYTLTGTVTGFGIVAPSGTVNFLDTTASTTIGSATLDPATVGFGFVQASGSPIPLQFVVQTAVGWEASGDFNDDGIPDLAVVSSDFQSHVYVLLGIGDGTFHAPAAYAIGEYTGFVTVADVNNDGHPDIIVANTFSGNVGVLLGNANGTFGAQTTFPVGSGPSFVAVGDVNGDGIPDLIVANTGDNTISVLLGNGTGHFATQVTYSVGSANGIAIGDFNGDGKPDLAVSNSYVYPSTLGSIDLLLGNGDGTFLAANSLAVPSGVSPSALGAADLRKDGRLDLIFADNGTAINPAPPAVYLMLANNDGTFGAVAAYPTEDYAQSVSVGDINHDGILDVVVPDSANDGNGTSVSVLIGNGDGTLKAKTDYLVGGDAAPYYAVLADFNGDGLLDISTANYSTRSVTTLLQQQVETATLSNTAVTGSGAHLADASYPGDTSHAPSLSTTTSLTPTIATTNTLTSSGLAVNAGASVTFTATIVPVPIGSTRGAVSFYSNGVLLGSGSVAINPSGVATYTTTGLAAGSHAITAVFSGNASYSTSTSAAIIETITAATTSILTVAPNPVVAGQSAIVTLTISPAPTGSPLGTVSFYNGSTLLWTGTVNSSGVAIFSTTTLPLGADSITAAYSGNAGFAGSTSTAISVQVNSANATATVTAITSSNLAPTYGQSVTLTATVTPAPSGTPPGTLSFYAGTTLLGTEALNAHGVGIVSLSLPLGPNAITAVYSGSAGFAASRSSALSISNRALSAIMLSASPTTQLATMPVVFTGLVNSATPGVQTGTVSFLNGSTVLATVTIVAGQPAVYSDPALSSGPHSVTATYSGDGSFLPSASNGAPISITVSDLNLALSGGNNKSVVPGGAVTYNFTLSPVVTSTFLYSVALTATGLPPGATYTFSHSTIPAGSGTLPVAFTVQTAKTTAMLHRAPGSSMSPWFALIFGLLLPLAGAKRFRARLTTLPRVLLLLLFGGLSLGLVAGLGGCGSGGFLGTPPGQTSYTITISATSGTLVRTSTVQLSLE
jgi:hypothetical protein